MRGSNLLHCIFLTAKTLFLCRSSFIGRNDQKFFNEKNNTALSGSFSFRSI